MDIDSLTLEEKVGQLFVVGFNETEVTGELSHLLTYFKVGGLFYGKENVHHLKQLHTLSTNVQFFAKTGLPLFLATEQEGGDVTIADSLTISPSQATMARANNRLYTKQMTEVVAKELRGIGISMNFAPILNAHEQSERLFGSNIDLIAKHGVAAIQGYQKKGVCSVVKYLPEIPINNLETISLDDKKSELYPFFRAIKHGVAGILVPNLLVQPTPNSDYTKKLLIETMRKRAKYDGLLITELESDEPSIIDSVMLAIEADVDVIFLRSNYKKQIDVIYTILEAVKTGEISEKRINRSVERILEIKEKFNVGEVTPFDRDLFKRKRSLDLADRIVERASVSN